MWLQKLKLTATLSLLFLAANLFAGEFSVMTYNLHRFTLDDRDGDGRKNDPKPDAECRALAGLVAAVRPDILAVQEIGGADALNAFRAGLKTEGLEYPYAELLQRGDRDINLAVLSRFPIVGSTPHTNEWYTIGPARLAVARGFQEVVIETEEGYRFHLLNCHLKSKVYSRLGQTEMWRNEARLLNKVVRRILEQNPGVRLLVTGDLNDNPNSAALREATGKKSKNLFDLRPVDSGGDAWTHWQASSDICTRLDYLLVNALMLGDAVAEKSFVVRDARTYLASDHRPVVAVFDTQKGRHNP